LGVARVLLFLLIPSHYDLPPPFFRKPSFPFAVIPLFGHRPPYLLMLRQRLPLFDSAIQLPFPRRPLSPTPLLFRFASRTLFLRGWTLFRRTFAFSAVPPSLRFEVSPSREPMLPSSASPFEAAPSSSANSANLTVPLFLPRRPRNPSTSREESSFRIQLGNRSPPLTTAGLPSLFFHFPTSRPWGALLP